MSDFAHFSMDRRKLSKSYRATWSLCFEDTPDPKKSKNILEYYGINKGILTEYAGRFYLHGQVFEKFNFCFVMVEDEEGGMDDSEKLDIWLQYTAKRVFEAYVNGDLKFDKEMLKKEGFAFIQL